MRSHLWKFELSGGRERAQMTLPVKELPVTTYMPSPQEAMREQQQDCECELPVESSS